MAGDQTGGAIGFVVLSGNLHLENFVGMSGSSHPGVGHESDQAFLKGAETALDLALGLGCGRHEMSDPQSAQGTLELALGVDAIIAGTGAEKAQSVGVDHLWDAVGLERLAKVQEVVPGRVGGDEAAREVQAGMVINGEQENLFGGGRPPLVNGAVVLPEFADGRATEAPVNTLLLWRGDDKMREVALDVSLGGGAGTFESAKAFHLIADKLVVGRVLKGQELLEEGMDPRGPEATAVPATCFGPVGLAVAKPVGSQPVQPGPADTELCGGALGIQQARVEVFEGSEDELRWQAVEYLFLFKNA